MKKKTTTGFYVEVKLDALKSDQQLLLGGKEEAMLLLKGLRLIPSMKGRMEGTKWVYPNGESYIAIQTSCFGRNVYVIQNSRKSGISYLVESTIMELLANEKLILAAIESFNPEEIEKRYNELVEGCSVNRSQFFDKLWASTNQIDLKIMANFEHLFNICVDKVNKTKGNDFDEESY